MRTLRITLAFCFTLRLFAQSCVTFAGAELADAFTGLNFTSLVLQPDGSYAAVTVTTAPPLTVVNVVPNFDQWIASCISPPTNLTLPSVSASTTAIGAASQVVAFGNFTGSGIPGAALTAFSSPRPEVRVVGVLQNGAAKATVYPIPNGAASVATADFNNDGKVDLVVVYTGSSNGAAETAGGVAILLGNGDGTFKSAVTYPAGVNALHVAIADLNGDGKLDLAVAADSGNSVTILLGNGDGTFSTGSTITTGLGQGPAAVIAADFNRDGKLDLATANEDGTVSILLGNGDGTFQAPHNFPAGSDCIYLAAADFNKDGKLDLAVANFNANLLTVLLGNGDGTFGAPAIYNTTYAPSGLIITDFNHDGNLDIVTGAGSPDIIGPDFGSGEIAVLLGNGDGTFQGDPLYPAGSASRSIAAGDLNGDGKPDLVSANTDSSTLTILLNQGNGTFAAAAPYSLTLPDGSNAEPVSVALADLNGDGKMDAAAANSDGYVSVSLGNGNGSFGAPTYYATGNDSAMVAIGDLNGDGTPDLVVANLGTLEDAGTDNGSVSVLLGSGGGAYKTATNLTTGIQPGFVVLHDLNGDGKLDLIVVNLGVPQGFAGLAPQPSGVAVLLGKGDGTFQNPVDYAAGTNPTAAAVGDLNGDGKPDLAVATTQASGAGAVAIFLGNGDGTFQNPSFIASQSAAADIAIADLNGDGKPDIVIASCCGETEMSYLLGNGDGTFQPEVLFNGGPSPSFLATADFNGDGKIDLAIADLGAGETSYVTVLLNTSQAPAPFSVSLSTAGQVEPFAPQAIVSAYGANLATGTAPASALPLPTTLDGTTVTVTDSTGAARLAPLFYVSPTQINYEIPEGTAAGPATVTIENSNGTSQTAKIQIGNTSPGLFELNSSGLVAAWVLPVISGTAQNLVPVYQLNASKNVIALPVNLGPSTEQVYLEMYGTGVRNATSVTATVGGLSVPVLFFGAAPGYAGEDQVNIGPLPRSLAGQGVVSIVLTASGQAANTVNIDIQ
jgi:uncharacterized protein (TIGR03437 family)